MAIKEKIFERNPNTGVIRWRYVGESHEKFCERFMNEGKEVHLLEMDDKDPSELGFNRFTELIQKSTPLTLSGLLARKLAL